MSCSRTSLVISGDISRTCRNSFSEISHIVARQGKIARLSNRQDRGRRGKAKQRIAHRRDCEQARFFASRRCAARIQSRRERRHFQSLAGHGGAKVLFLQALPLPVSGRSDVRDPRRLPRLPRPVRVQHMRLPSLRQIPVSVSHDKVRTLQ